MVSVKIPLFVAVTAVALFGGAGAGVLPHIHPGVHRTLQKQGTVNLFVTLRESTEAVLESVKEVEFATRGTKIASLVDRLTAHAEKTQAPLNALLAKEAASNTNGAGSNNSVPLYSSKKSFWISNQVYFKDATFELVEKLSSLPSVSEVQEELVLPLLSAPTESTITSNVTAKEAIGLMSSNEWGITKIQALDVWATGNSGQGVVVGVIDTGVRYTHSAIRGSFRSDYGWFDPATKSPTPYDDVGHGTHVTGTIAGADGIGVAPGTKWIACRGCLVTGCDQSLLAACAEFMVCPTDTNGNNKDCSKAPQVVSNSWGSATSNPFFAASVALWRAAGIIPVFSIGNTGPNCGTTGSPGDYDSVVGVGQSGAVDNLLTQSSKGPTTSGLIKPDIAAPGENIRSAWITGDYDFKTLSGTSMAAPHVAGVVALMLTAHPKISFDQVRAALASSAEKWTLKPTNMYCGGIPSTTFPNNDYGHGRVNAFGAVVRTTDRCGDLGELLCGELLCEWRADTASCASW